MRSLWPNPVGNSGGLVSVRFELATSDRVSLKVYDVAGRLVGSSTPRDFDVGGEYILQWDAGNLASGVYFVRLMAEGGLTAPAKLVIVR